MLGQVRRTRGQPTDPGQDLRVDQIDGEQREAWARLVERAPRFKGYTTKTDRRLPVLRLTPVS